MNKCANALCGRTGDDIGQCGAHATCPHQAVPIEPTDIVLHCTLCEITRVVPAATVIQGKHISEAHMCLSDVCQCRPVMQAPVLAPVKGKPPKAQPSTDPEPPKVQAADPSPVQEPATDGEAPAPGE